MPLTRLQTELHREARGRIAQGELPYPPRRVWAGKGTEAPCTLCGEPISSAMIEYEVQVKNGFLRFHYICHGVWQLECARATQLRKRSSPA